MKSSSSKTSSKSSFLFLDIALPYLIFIFWELLNIKYGLLYVTNCYIYNMGRPKFLTEQQKKFATLLITNIGRKTPTECAIEAGYSEASANVRASELRNPRMFPLVVKYIDELRAEVQEKYKVDYGSHIQELAKLREEARDKGAWSAAINAEVARGKAAGLYIEQKIIKHGKLEDLTEKELEARLSHIIEENKLLLEHEDVDTLKDKVQNPRVMRKVNQDEENSQSQSIQEEET